MKIYLHIGASVIGTKTFQEICWENQGKLGEMGMVYPLIALLDEQKGIAQHNLAFSLLDTYPDFVGENGRMSKEEAWGQLRNVLEKLPSKKDILISSEAFSSLNETGVGYVAQQVKGYDCEVLYIEKTTDKEANLKYGKNKINTGSEPKQTDTTKVDTVNLTNKHLKFWKKKFPVTTFSNNKKVYENIFSKMGVEFSKLTIPKNRYNETPIFATSVLRDLKNLNISSDKHSKITNFLLTQLKAPATINLNPTLVSIILIHYGISKRDVDLLLQKSSHEILVGISVLNEMENMNLEYSTKCKITRAIFSNIASIESTAKKLGTEDHAQKFSLNENIAEKKISINGLQSEIDIYKKEIETLKSQLNQNTKTIQNATTEEVKTHWAKTVKAYNAQDGRKNAQIEILQSRLSQDSKLAQQKLDAVQKKQKALLDSHQQRETENTRVIQELQRNLNQLRSAFEETQRNNEILEAEIEAVRSTKIWKLNQKFRGKEV